MRDVTYYVAMSLDGKIAAPDGDYSAFPQGGDHIETILNEYTDTIPVHVQSALGLHADGSKFDTVLMGWNTYAPALDAGIASPYPHLNQVVVSRQPRNVPPDISLSTDPRSTIRQLRGQPGTGIWIAGGGHLAGSVFDEIDHLVLKNQPGCPRGRGTPVWWNGLRAKAVHAHTVSRVRLRGGHRRVLPCHGKVAAYARNPAAMAATWKMSCLGYRCPACAYGELSVPQQAGTRSTFHASPPRIPACFLLP